MKGTPAGDGLKKPLLSPRSMAVQVYSPYGKQVVETDINLIAKDLPCAALSAEESEVMYTIRASVMINFFLFIAKVWAFVMSGSLAVLASLVDSAIDLLGQGVLMWTKQLAYRQDREYPVGRGRLEPVGVMVCAVLMGMASIEVISTSIRQFIKFSDLPLSDAPSIALSGSTVALLIGVIVLKGVLYIWCLRVLKRYPNNESVKAISMDNQNDVFSNLSALLAAAGTKLGPRWWVLDPGAGIVISLYIIYTWLMTGYEQVEMIVGKRADADFLRSIQELAENHNPKMMLDQLCAYHFGPRYLVELEVVMAETTPLRESHDAGISLQHEIEKLEEVERCFVHIDYQFREQDDHDPNVPIEAKLYGGPQPASGAPRTGTPRAISLGDGGFRLEG